MKNIFKFIVIFLIVLSFSSCYCDKTYVGNVNNTESLVHVASVRNEHVLGGLIVTHNQKSFSIPDSIKDYVIERKFTLGDLLASTITFGLYTPTTTKFYVKKDNSLITHRKFGSKNFSGNLHYIPYQMKDTVKYIKGLFGRHRAVYNGKYWVIKKK